MLVDSFALVGEVLSWVGLGVGLPVLLVAAVLRSVAADWKPVHIVVVEQQGRLVGRWFASGEIQERPLRPAETEQVTDGGLNGYLSSRDPGRIRLSAPSSRWVFLSTIGWVFLAAGGIGFVVSLLPLVL